MGSLFEEKLFRARDVHHCLSLLVEGEKRFDRLCAMHALLVQANDKLCKNRNLPALMQFRNDITCTSTESGEYLWATTPRSQMILTVSWMDGYGSLTQLTVATHRIFSPRLNGG